jgi:CubicO group peptidase (beta-lactamase class C family)
MKIDGTCKRGFERIAEAFERNFAERGEVGASVCATVGGETVVDLWGGSTDSKTNAPWQKDTVGIVFSCTKGATALCAHMLASRGKLDLDAPVTELWPEFGQNGKERVTTRMMLDYSAGVPALRDKVKDSGPYEWDYMTERLAAEAPFWEPGTRNGYHGFTFGWTVGEMVRRASAGQSARIGDRKAAASWSMRRRSPAWAKSRWRRTTTRPCASRRALRWAS